MSYYNPILFAQAYGEGNYSTSTYQDGTTASTAAASGTNGSNTNGGTLSNTGFDILLVATIACALICAAVVVRVWKRPSRSRA